MKEYIYKGTNNFYYEDVVIAMPEDILRIDDNVIKNVNTNNKFYSIPEQYLTNILADCYLLGGVEEEEEVPVIMTDTEKFERITKTMLDTFKKKNHDYGNSFEQSLNEEGLAASRIRIGDKWNRFKNLSKGINAHVSNESLQDTLLDMANYAIMTLVWLSKQ